MYTRKYDILETLRPVVSLDPVTHTVVTLKTDNSSVFFYLLLSSSIFFCRLLSYSVVFCRLLSSSFRQGVAPRGGVVDHSYPGKKGERTDER